MKLYTQQEIREIGGNLFAAGYWNCAFMHDGRIAIRWDDSNGYGYLRIVSRIKGIVWLRRSPALFAMLPADIRHCVENREIRYLKGGEP